MTATPQAPRPSAPPNRPLRAGLPRYVLAFGGTVQAAYGRMLEHLGAIDRKEGQDDASH